MSTLVILLLLVAYLVAGVFVNGRLHGEEARETAGIDSLDVGAFLLQTAIWPVLLGAWLLWGDCRSPGNGEPLPRLTASVEAGSLGRTVNELRPWGRVEIDGRACDARAEAGFITSGRTIIVTGSEAQGLVVREHSQ